MFKVEILENAQNYPFSEILSQMDLENSLAFRASISGTEHYFLVGWLKADIESSLMSGCGKGHESTHTG